MSELPHPRVSTGTTVPSVVPEGWGPPRSLSQDTFNISFTKRRQRFTLEVGPDYVLTHGKRIEGLAREIAAKYVTLRYGKEGKVGCTIRSPFCNLGDNTFPDPRHADFDHINGNRLDHRTGNIRPACHPCNSWAQKFQWKSSPAPTSAERVSVREGPARAAAWGSREGEQSEKQTAYWDLWLQRTDKDSPWLKLGVKPGEFVRLADLTDLAPREIGRLYVLPYGVPKEKFGSSATYRRYAMEDRFTVLEVTKERGEYWARLRTEQGKP